jgi:hypothetical protein
VRIVVVFLVIHLVLHCSERNAILRRDKTSLYAQLLHDCDKYKLNWGILVNSRCIESGRASRHVMSLDHVDTLHDHSACIQVNAKKVSLKYRGEDGVHEIS